MNDLGIRFGNGDKVPTSASLGGWWFMRRETLSGLLLLHKRSVKWNANRALLDEQFVIIYFFGKTWPEF